MHLFYHDLQNDSALRLENEEHRHCSQVLRHVVGDLVHVTDGMGKLAEVEITDVQRRFTAFKVVDVKEVPTKSFAVHIAISPTKQMDRMEWFVEIACEMGADDITFLQTKHSERPMIKLDRLEKKTISALKQSKSAWKTCLHPMVGFKGFLERDDSAHKYIAAVDANSKYLAQTIEPGTTYTVLIGPEGDFTQQEVNLALSLIHI